MIIELRHLRSLQAIHEAGSLAKASELLHLTQSALSHQIKTLESYFDILLYHRKCKPLKLTTTGQELLDLAQKILPKVEAAEHKLTQFSKGTRGRLHITIECHSCFEWLIPTLDYYRNQWPEVEVDIRLGVNFNPLPALLHGDIDVVITSDQINQAGIVFEPLFDFEALAIMANDHSLAQHKFLRPSDFIDQTLITYPVNQSRLDIFTKFLNLSGVTPAQIRQTELTAMILQLVASRRGISVLPDWVLEEYIASAYVTAKSLKISPDSNSAGMTATLYAATREQDTEQGYLVDFIEMARNGLNLRNN